jgi:hypothetical protein
MKYLLAPVVLVALLFAAPAYAETIVMECRETGDADPTRYKYESPLIGKAKVFLREDGEWVVQTGYRIDERGVVREITMDAVADDDTGELERAANMKKGDEFQLHAKWVLDFDFFEKRLSHYLTNMDGSPLAPGKESYDSATPQIDVQLCKKPDESWEDRETR